MRAESISFSTSAKQRKTISKLLKEWRKGLVSQITKKLTSTAFENRYVLHPRRLNELGSEEVDVLINYVNTQDIDSAITHGRKRALEGLGESPLLSIGRIFRQFMFSQKEEFDNETAKEAFEFIDDYLNVYLTGYIMEREAQTLKDQELLRKALSAALDKQRRELHIKNHAIHTYSNGIMITDLEGKITYLNPAFIKMWKYENFDELVNTDCSQFLGIASIEKILAALQESVGWQNEITAVCKDSSSFEVVVSASLIQDAKMQPVGIMASFIDVTDRKRLEAQFRQAQKMEALGQLAGGIVHDFNNLLQVISGFTELELTKLPKESEKSQNFMQIKIAADRGKDLTSQLRFFTRQASGKLIPLNINSTITEIESLAKRTFPPQLNIELKLNPGLQIIEADPSQMSQMLLNLCMNARDAMIQSDEMNGSDGVGGTSPGKITIESDNIHLDRRSASRYLNAKPGQYVCVKIRDTGVGMDSDVIERLFEPFFTTKGEKSGTGLGLSVVYGIVQTHNGFIDVKSGIGKGSTFEIYLPVVKSAKKTSGLKDSKPALVKGKGTILLVEDQEQVRELTISTLKKCGYNILVAEDGLKAVSLYRDKCDDIDLVLLDVIMPKMGGWECFNQLKEINSSVSVLIITGYTADGSSQDFLKEGAIGIIEKPFNLDEFTHTVSKIIKCEQ
jgi:PAS domain S-box-containing protein